MRNLLCVSCDCSLASNRCQQTLVNHWRYLIYESLNTQRCATYFFFGKKFFTFSQIIGRFPSHRHSSDKSEQSIILSQTPLRFMIIVPSKHSKHLVLSSTKFFLLNCNIHTSSLIQRFLTNKNFCSATCSGNLL